MAETTITIDDVEDGVALLWLDRPERGNAFTFGMQAELHDAFADLDARDEVRVIVVTGRGRFFSTGADVGGGGSTFSQSDRETAELRDTVSRRTRPWEMRTPIIGALNGAAVGLGLTLPLQWDIRVMAEDAKYGFVFPRRGITPEAASTWLLPRLVGLSVATELLLTGRFFTGADAVAYGLATRAVPADEVLPTSLALAHEIAVNCSPAAVGLTKQLLREAMSEPDREQAWSRDWELFRWIGRQPDAAEGVQSFLDKRSPTWTGSKQAEPPLPSPRPWEVPDG